jgi:cell division topological specificity factor
MASFFDRFKGRKEPTSAEMAKQRLQLVLVTDRSNLSQEKLEEMQEEIIKVIKRYVTIDDMEVRLSFEQRDRKYHLVADIPLHRDPNYGAIEAPGPPETQGDGKMVDAESEQNATDDSNTATQASAEPENETSDTDAAADEDDISGTA